MSSLPVQRAAKRASFFQASQPAVCSVVLDDREVSIPASAHTLPGFRAWAASDDFPERGQITYVGGEIIIAMSPEELETHNAIKAEAGYVLVGLNKKRKMGKFFADRALLINVVADLSTEPDAMFVRWATLETGQVRLVPRQNEQGQYLELEGTPDWVMEIVSDSSVRKDTQQLRERYHRAGIPEYWLIDARGETIDFQILVRGEAGYASTPGRAGWQTSPLFGRRFRLMRRRGRLGLWEYTLQGKPLRGQ